MGQFILGIDVGLTFLKSVIYDVDGNLISESRKQTPVIVNAEDTSEINMRKLWTRVKSTIKESLFISKISPDEILGIGVSGHGNGVYFTDINGSPFENAITSMDHRASKIVNECLGIENKLRETTLQSIWDGQPGMILKWIKRNQPEVYDKIAHIMLCKDWITFCLTGEMTTDYSDMSSTGLLDNITKKYNKKIFHQLGLDEICEKLPPVLKSCQIAGQLTEKSCGETGLKKGTPVIAGLFDVDACGIGAGLIEKNQICSIAGTWNINMALSNVIIKNDNIRQCTIRGDNSSYLVIDSSPTSSSNIDWVLRNLFIKKISFSDYERVLAEYSPVGKKIIFMPFLYGGLGKDSSGGHFLNLKNFYNYKDVLGAVSEGICYAHLYHINNILNNKSGINIIRLTGGASRNPYWCQMFADITGKQVEIPESHQTGTLGLCIMASVGAGLYKSTKEAVNKMVRVKNIYNPDKEKRLIYKDKYGKFLEMLNKINN
jgi:L-xylulokinase